MTDSKKLKKDYHSESARLAKAIDLAIDAFEKFPPEGFTGANTEHLIKVYTEMKFSLLNPGPGFKKLASLNYYAQDVLTFFHESTGRTVDYFWQQIKENNPGYVRRDKLRKILDRGKIKGRIESDYVTDMIVAAQQEGRTTKEETHQLGQMLQDFENDKKVKR